ncbi:hypothetical protein DXG01_000642 [Tephrocybe rancida]|nr:hypothetical protein DXG01_000642 [Tephrocybe rancida]
MRIFEGLFILLNAKLAVSRIVEAVKELPGLTFDFVVVGDFMGYTRGSSDDYDRYARLTGDSGWSWDRLQPYFRKNEKWAQPADGHNTTGQFNPSVHGFRGINSVSLPGFSQGIDDRVIQTTRELPGEFPFNEDTNSGHQLGLGWTQSTIGHGMRSSSATSYLGPQFNARSNLNVLLHAQVSRIVKTGTKKGELVFQAVEFTEGVDGKRSWPKWLVTANKEVILSAGAIGTPHILLNSGIGNESMLSLLGIEALVNLPSVGQNLSDHPTVGNQYLVNSTNTFEELTRNSTLAEKALHQWNETRTGPFTNGISHPPPPATGNFLVMGGSVTLNSNKPFDPPVIDPGFLSSDFDMFVLREAIRSARRFVAAPAWANYIISSVSNAITDEELDAYIRTTAVSIFHPVGTAAMSPKGADFGVVDPDLRVKNVRGLRVVDASVLPVVPAGHTQAATYVIAERASDLIKDFWRSN